LKTENTTDTNQFDVDVLQKELSLLGTQFFGLGRRTVFLPVVESTNILAMQCALKGADEGTVILTDSQTAGKGRLGRRWIDVRGKNVLSSTIVTPHFPPYLLIMLASLAVVDAIAECCGLEASIKWPNDILIGSRKVAGILIETSHDLSGRMVAVMGIGINVNGRIEHMPLPQHTEGSVRDSEQTPAQAAPQQRATTLETECEHPVQREILLAHLLYHLERVYLALQQEAQEGVAATNGDTQARQVLNNWRQRLSTLGRSIKVHQGNTLIEGVAEDVGESGELILRSSTGKRVIITWGDVGYPSE
jgi:BirA family biotin operon repressor/biotin-[acetyl-CoA-carboxylase] ligase